MPRRALPSASRLPLLSLLPLLSGLGLTGCEPTGRGLTVSPSNDTCQQCHADIYAEWAQSGHALGGGSPVFVALVADVAREWGPKAADTCRGCHEPGVRLGTPSVHGIGCVTCHAAVKNRAERDGELVLDLNVPLAGPTAAPATHSAHSSGRAGLPMDSALCRTCHEVSGPRLFVEHTGREHRAIPGPGCVACHMPLLPTPHGHTDPSARPRRRHSFVGIRPPFGVSPERQAASAAQARALLASGLSLDAWRDPTTGLIEIRLANTLNGGHKIPTGVAFVRDIWVEVDGVRALSLGAELYAQGQPVALPTQADTVISHALAPGETRSLAWSTRSASPVSLGLSAPPAPSEAPASAPSSAASSAVSVVLYARAFRPALLEALGISALLKEIPLLEVQRIELPPGLEPLGLK